MPITYRSIPVPQSADGDRVGESLPLPERIAAALAAAGGALVRTVYLLERDGDRIVALGYHRPGTAQQKLTALTGAPGLLADLCDRVAEELVAEGAVSLKLELPDDDELWTQAALAAGFVPLVAPGCAAPPPEPAATAPRGLVRRLGDWQAPELTYFRQTTDFTCGPVAALTAANALGLTPPLDRGTELDFWRRATSMPACDGYGLAATLAEQGVPVTVLVNTTEALQLETEPPPWQRNLREYTQADFRARAEKAGAVIRVAEFDIEDLLGIVAAGGMVLLLIDELLMHAEACAHWVVVHGVHDRIALIEDPWTDADLGETWVDAHQLPVSADILWQMAGWNGYRSAVVLQRA